MTTEFVFLSLPRDELTHLYHALLSSFFIEQALRCEQGLEPIDHSLLLRKIEQLMRASGDPLPTLSDHVEDELWAYAWYTFNDEWAWFRAKQDAGRALGDRLTHAKHETFERLIEKLYRKNFDAYMNEIDMQESMTKTIQTQKKKTKKK